MQEVPRKIEKPDLHIDAKRVAEVIAPKNFTESDMDWVQANIQSIQEAVSFGNHDVVYYPASGLDLLRVVIAYDASHLISVDSRAELSTELQRQLSQLGIHFNIAQPSPEKAVFTFELAGKSRTITHVTGEARMVTPSTLGIDSVDVLHVYLPTGADEELRADEVYFNQLYGDDYYRKSRDGDAIQAMLNDPDAPRLNDTTHEYDPVASAVSTRLNSKNYSMVKEGGFFTLDEKRLQYGTLLPSVYRMAGLKEYKITHRHPYTVSTSLYPDKDQMAEFDRSGYLFQKEKLVNPEIIDVVSEVFYQQFWIDYVFMELERGGFEYLGLKDNQPVDVIAAFQKYYQELIQDIEEFAKQLKSAGALDEDIAAFRNEMLEDYRTRVQEFWANAQQLLAVYQDVSDKLNAEELTNEGAIKALGIVEKPNVYGSVDYLNTVFPLAAQLALGSDEQHEKVLQVLNQLASAQENFLSEPTMESDLT